jgi:hypothetical protein
VGHRGRGVSCSHVVFRANSRVRLWRCRVGEGYPIQDTPTERDQLRRLGKGGEKSHGTSFARRPFQRSQFGRTHHDWPGTAPVQVESFQQSQCLGGPTGPVDHTKTGGHSLCQAAEILGRPTRTHEDPRAGQFPFQEQFETGLSFQYEQSGGESQVRVYVSNTGVPLSLRDVAR